jgi:hypothetical protein
MFCLTTSVMAKIYLVLTSNAANNSCKLYSKLTVLLQKFLGIMYLFVQGFNCTELVHYLSNGNYIFTSKYNSYVYFNL